MIISGPTVMSMQQGNLSCQWVSDLGNLYCGNKVEKTSHLKTRLKMVPAGCSKVELPSVEARTVFFPGSLACIPESLLRPNGEK